MTRIIFLVVFVFQNLSVSAQNTDSLWTVWENKSLSDSVRIDALCELSEILLETHPDSANALADTIINISNRRELIKHYAHALKIKGEYYQHLYKFDTALGFFNSSLEILKEYDLKPDMIILYEAIGNNYFQQHDYQKAHEYFERYLNESLGIKDTLGIAKANQNIGINYYFQGDYLKSLDYFLKAIDLYRDIDSKEDIADMHLRLGAIFYHQGNYTKAIQYFNKYFEYDVDSENIRIHAEIYTNLGAIYFQQADYVKAKEYYEKGLRIDEQFEQHRGIAIGYFNLGECFLEQGDLSVAMEYFQKSLNVCQQYFEKDLIADCYLAMGLINMKREEYTEARIFYQQSLEAAREIGYNSILSSIYTYQGNLFNILSDHTKALDKCKQGYEESIKTGDIQEQISACECLYATYKALGDAGSALEYHETFLTLTDSLHNEETVRQLQQMEFKQQMLADSLKMEEEKFQAALASEREINKQKTRKNLFLTAGIGIFILSIGLYSRLTYIRKSRSVIQKEKERSENLLLNILPVEVAEELKLKGESVARDFEDVTVLFTDFKEFTSIAESLNAQELVAEINTCFKAFDDIITLYGIEKIKTIGDAYMAAGGMQATNTSTAKEVVLAGLEMQSFMETRKKELQEMGKSFFEMRVGIHTGQVVAGIVGVKKFQYDIWGDTVNIASRMESSGKVGKVNISASTYDYIKDDPNFSFSKRGRINAKNKGLMEMYFVSLKEQSQII
jgi:tetratricopeptide (TPR) repeat protein